MDLKMISPEKVKTLEDYAAALTLGLISLKSLGHFHEKAIDEGFLPDDLIERAKVLLFDLRNVRARYAMQMSSVLELLPDDYSAHKTIEGWKNE